MEFSVNDPKNIMGMARLLCDDRSIDIEKIERDLIESSSFNTDDTFSEEQIQRDFDRLGKSIANINVHAVEHPKEISLDKPMESNIGIDNVYDYKSTPLRGIPSSTSHIAIEDPQLRKMTIEQQKQSYVDDVLKDIDDDRDFDFDIEKEKEEDDKASMLEQIDTLRSTLLDDGFDLRSVPVVTQDNSLHEIQSVFKTLRLKDDSNRCSSLANELLISFAHFMEFLFDGKKEWFGQTPDLVGWHQTVKMKTRRMRYITSTIVRDIMQDYNIGPVPRLVMELVPSAIFYSKQKNDAKLINNNISDAKFADATTEINIQMSK